MMASKLDAALYRFGPPVGMALAAIDAVLLLALLIGWKP
jgi:hypothetical protein